jgi:hypothetical protein
MTDKGFDFRRVDAGAVRVAKAPTRSMYSLAPRVPVQLPRVALNVSLGNFGYSALARFNPEVPSHAAFCAWVDRVEANAMRQISEIVGPLKEDAWVPTLKGYGNFRSMYLTIGTDSTVFGEDKEIFEASPTTLKFADVLCEIQGIWTKPDQMGLRWRIVQVLEASEGPREPPPKPAFADDDADYSTLLRPDLDEDRVFKKRRLEPSMLFLDDE